MGTEGTLYYTGVPISPPQINVAIADFAKLLWTLIPVCGDFEIDCGR